MPVRKVFRGAAGLATAPNGGPNWNTIRIDSTSNQLIVGSGGSGSVEVPVSGFSNVISGSGATVALTAVQSGSLCLFDRAAGIVYTLPAPTVGLSYSFLVTTSITTNAAEVATNTETTDFLLGSISMLTVASAVTFAAVGNGTTHVEISMNGTTTGGLAGTAFTVYCVTTTQWFVEGFAVGSGTLATPFLV